MSTDLTFITNEENQNLLERFNVLIKDTRFFDVLVGYFYSSGFYRLYQSLENTEKIRVLIGISTNKQVLDLIKQSRVPVQTSFQFSYAEVKEQFSDTIASEMAVSEDDANIEQGVYKFIDWLKSGKLELKAYPSENIHAKLYIMTFAEGDRDAGRVITGSSNFTSAGLVENLEFNVELKNRSDYEFAHAKFNELWENAVDVGEKYLETIRTKTWLNDTITPYELYLKFLYEYFRDKINIDQEEIYQRYLPENFLDLEYQSEAVKDAKSKLEEYGGVFISDVVGLGKTYVSAMLAQQLDGRSLVIAPPVLLERENPGSWPNVFSDFRVHADFESLGKLDKLIERGTDKYKNIFIDEAHRFRTETNITYEQLAQICRGKRVVLVTATPLNNAPRDILAQIKLFQKARKSTIPNLPDLEQFFLSLEKKLKKLDRQRNYDEYIHIVRDNARQVREKVLKYLMVRRTRSEIVTYFGHDLQSQNLRFPEVADPAPVFYELNKHEDDVFDATVELIAKKFKYARYAPMLYYKGEISQPEELAQINMRKFMKILLVKRLESSIFAFRNTLNRFIRSYEHFLREFEKGNVYVSKKYINKIFEFLEDDNDEAIQRLIDEDKAEKYGAGDFRNKFRKDLEHDLNLLRHMGNLWSTIRRDPKLIKFADILRSLTILRENKLIIFTESKETAEYLADNLSKQLGNAVLSFSGASGVSIREKVIDNFDARARIPQDEYRILITTEVLSEGVNLHRSNVVINYDIPWNPTRLIQRVGRINRVDTKFDTIHTFNFFPTRQSNDQIKLREAAESKIQAFIEMLGTDARLLTEGEEIKSHDLFARLMSKKTITGEDESEESELKYLQIIRSIRDNDPDTFDKVKRLPRKARTARGYPASDPSLLTYFRKGKLQKFYLADAHGTQELDFFSAAKTFEVERDAIRGSIGKDFYELLEKNKRVFEAATSEEFEASAVKSGRDSATALLHILKSTEIRKYKGFTDDDELYIGKVITLLEEGGLPKQTTRTLLKALHKELKEGVNPLRILAVLRTTVASEFFRETVAESAAQTSGPREIILSEYLETLPSPLDGRGAG
ncbi:MAG: helicase [Syntrophobacterales bacterium CG_4_8_14_3_um_filter_49_14]|nr:MAG: helicase [Syntrophobacterales bacterium CG23_combo_of_CG06-09_8_20_14_all_48_27]PJC76163.1 MAG: helicase [Syntrophobacterales bacterium CG_4_8_14_3_um_filter_49_14]